MFSKMPGVEPTVDPADSVGFRLQGQENGLDPNGHKQELTPYYPVDDIRQRLASLVQAGAQILQEVKAIGAAGLIAAVRDADDNISGPIQ